MLNQKTKLTIAAAVVAAGTFGFASNTNAENVEPNELADDFKAFTDLEDQARVTGAAFLDTGAYNGGRISAIAGEVLIGPGKIIQSINNTTFAVGFANLGGADGIIDNTVIEQLSLGTNGRLAVGNASNNLERAVIDAINGEDAPNFNVTQANALVRNFQNSRSNTQAHITGAGFLDTSAENGGRISAAAGEIELAPGQSFATPPEPENGEETPPPPPFATVNLAFQGPDDSPNLAIRRVQLNAPAVEEANPLEDAVADVVERLVDNEAFSAVQTNALVDAFGGGSSSENFTLD